MIGFAGDIFMGRYDDSKYVADLKEEARAAKPLSAAADFAIATMRTSRDLADLGEFWTKNAKGLRADLRPFEFEAVEKAKDAEKVRLSKAADETPFDQKEAA
jgi:hypothetical protein